MSEILIIKGGDQGSFGQDAMANTVGICDCILKDAKDGDPVEAKIKGTFMEHDGKRYISIDEVDGQPVEDPEMPMDMNPDENAMDMGSPQDHVTGAEDALMNFMKQYKGK